MNSKKKLIEVALPLEAINKASAREKSIRHGHPSTLHLWWARRPLAAARAVIFAQMVDDPSVHPERFPTEEAQERERQRLFQLIEELVKWENTTNETVLAQAREEIWKSWQITCAENRDHPRAAELFNPDKLPAFHDPFAGGGALPLEAQRLGLESYASDLNPVAVLINKAMIEIPPKFAGRAPINPESRRSMAHSGSWKGAAGLAEDVRYYGKWMRDEAEKRIGHLYPKIEITAEMTKERPDLKLLVGRKLTVIAWLWARTVKSPNPAFAHVDVPLASTFMLSTKVGKEAYVEPVIEEGGYRFTVKVGKPKDAEAAKRGTKSGGSGTSFLCLMSGTPMPFDYLRSEAKAGRMGARLMAIVAEGERGRVYLSPTSEHEAIALSASPNDPPETDLPVKALGFRVQEYGMAKWRDLFTLRQLVALTTFSELVQEAREKIKADYLSSSPSPFMERGPGGEVPITGHAPVSAEKLNFAKQMRKLPTNMEARAWELLRNRRCLGLKFRRQQVIQGFIVDFYCAEKRIALELDGDIHWETADYDRARDAVLAQAGVRVLRIRNEEVSREGIEALLTSPPGPLSMNGEGEKEDIRLVNGGTGTMAYAEAVGVYLAFAIDRMAMTGNSLVRWNSVGEKAQHCFGRQALPMLWDFAEPNFLATATGSVDAAVFYSYDPLNWMQPPASGLSKQEDAANQLSSSAKVVSTDPPYYDNIGYADLSDFFYIWLRRSLKPAFPDLFATLAVPKAEELVATPYRHGSKEKAEAFFLDGMSQAMHRLVEQAHPAFPVTIYYAFKQSESESDAGTASTGWETFLDAVIRAGFALTGTWPMRTEMRTRQIAMDTNALASSIILVCRKRAANAPTATRREFLSALKSELPAALHHLQRGNIAPVDMAQAAIGPGMAIFTRYAKVLESDDSPMKVRTALQLINQALDEYLSAQEGEYDADTRFAITWFETHGMEEGPYGVAETLATARGVSVSGVQQAGLLISKRQGINLRL